MDDKDYRLSDDKNFDVDELVKRIDAKIAEIEEEEKREQEKLNSQENTSANSKDELLSGTVLPSTLKTSIDSNIETKKTGITDDQYFDDFFDDE